MITDLVQGSKYNVNQCMKCLRFQTNIQDNKEEWCDQQYQRQQRGQISKKAVTFPISMDRTM